SKRDKPSTAPERASRATTMRPPAPPRPAPRRESLRIADLDRGGIVESAIAHDRPTPRSTVIPRLPTPVTMAMRPRLPTLIFHGAPPLPPPPPLPRALAMPTTMRPPPREDGVLEVHSSELLAYDDEEIEEDFDSARPTPFHPAHTDRPPPPTPRARSRRERGRAIAVRAALV